MAVTEIAGKDVYMRISTNLVTPAYKSLVCATDSFKLSGSRTINKVLTQCGKLVAAGETDWNVTGQGVASTTPEADEMSIDELIAVFNTGADVLVELSNDDDYVRRSRGIVSNYNEVVNLEGHVVYDLTVELQGEVATA